MAIERHDVGTRMSKCVVHGNTVYLSGIVANDPKGKSVTEQTKDILGQIDGYLKTAGTDKSKVVQATVWLNDIRNRDGMNKAWSAWLGGKDAPARACVEAKVIDPRMLVEISVVAVK